MEVLYPCCCGWDVHKKRITACVLWAEAKRGGAEAEAPFRDVYPRAAESSGLAARVRRNARGSGIDRCVREAGGEHAGSQCEIVLVNAPHLQAVPGRKTDQKDSEWIADLLQPGLWRGSFVPPRGTRELGDLTRYRVSLTEECHRMANRMQRF